MPSNISKAELIEVFNIWKENVTINLSDTNYFLYWTNILLTNFI